MSGSPGADARRPLDGLLRWLSVAQGFETLETLFPEAPLPPACALFEACLARREGDDLRVHAFLASSSPDFADHRAGLLRDGLRGLEPRVGGRIRASVWAVEGPGAPTTAWDAFLNARGEHFLSKTLLGRGRLGPGPLGALYAGVDVPVPSAQELERVLDDPSLDPGEAEAERVRSQRTEAALGRLGQERRSAWMLRPGPSPVTWALIGANVAVFLLQVALSRRLALSGAGDAADGLAMLRLGANEPGRTLGGAWWRVLSSAFLHGEWWHLGLNMYALFLLGAVAERLVGPWRFLAAYLAFGACAGLVSALLNPPGTVSVGASGAILGVIGLLLAPRFRRDPRFPEVLAGRLFQWLIRPVAFLFVLGVSLRLLGSPLILDDAAHLGGLLAGFALGYGWPSFLVRPARPGGLRPSGDEAR